LIVGLKTRITILEDKNLSLYKSFTDELGGERQKFKVQSELVTYENSLKEIALQDARKFRRQRNWLLTGIGVCGAYGLVKVFVPP